MKHIIVFLTIISVLLFAYVIWPRLQSRFTTNINGSIDINTVSSIMSTLISIVSLGVAFWSISISKKQMADAEQGAVEQRNSLIKQQKALDESRQALTKMVDLASNQLILAKIEKDEREREQAKRPEFEFVVSIEHSKTTFESIADRKARIVTNGPVQTLGPFSITESNPIKPIEILAKECSIDYEQTAIFEAVFPRSITYNISEIPEGMDVQKSFQPGPPNNPDVPAYIFLKKLLTSNFVARIKLKNIGNKPAKNLRWYAYAIDKKNEVNLSIFESPIVPFPSLVEFSKTGEEINLLISVKFPSELRQNKNFQISIGIKSENTEPRTIYIPILIKR